MFRSVQVENYRGFASYTLSDIAQVNLLVGRNNVGKTSLLEVAELAQSSAPLTTLRSIALRRRELGGRHYEASQAYYQDLIELNHVFPDHRVELNTTIKIATDAVAPLVLSVEPNPDTQAELEGIETFGEPSMLLLNARQGSDVIERAVISDVGTLLEPRRLRPPRARHSGAVFISPDSMSPATLIGLYNEVIRSASEDVLVRALNLLDETVTGVFFLASDRSGAIDGSAGILIGRNGSERHPIGSFGDGMRRLLALAMAMVNTKSGVLLVDEIDTGLHYSVMPDLWKLVLGVAQKLNIQVFATTHSLDCVRGLHLALDDHSESAAEVAIHKIDARLSKAVTFSGDRLLNALRADLELR